MHIDVNNAFLSWTAIELLNKGYKYDIRKSFAVIGGDPKARHGIVIAKSMAAKKLGIKTAETLYSAKKKCRVLRVYEPNYKFYQEMSNKMFNLLYDYTSNIQIASIDECYLDYTEIQNIYGEPIEFAKKIQKQILDELGFTVNVGIANNKLCAKMASDFEKPYKIHTLFENQVEEKMWPLDVGELFGVGKKTKEKLNKININTIEELAKTDYDYLYKYFKNQASYLIDIANGIDNSPVISEARDPKGIGNEITLSKDIINKEEIFEILEKLSKMVSYRLKKQKKYGYTITVLLKDNMFIRTSHQKRIKNATNDDKLILETSKELYEEMKNEKPIRLIGIRINNLTDTLVHQVSIFDEEENQEQDLSKEIENIKNQYGKHFFKE